MKKIRFLKLSAAGNDFVLIDKRDNPDYLINPKDIIFLCDRHFGVGADGVLTINDSSHADFEMEYFNSDGSTGMLCGNGARSIIKYADYSGRIKNCKTEFLFHSEQYSGKVKNNDEIEFYLNPPKDLKLSFEISVWDKVFSASFIDTGAFHVVIDLDEQKIDVMEFKNLNKFPVHEIGKAIRYHKKFEPQGTNVNFIHIQDDLLEIRTFERGVEKETLACGTGSVASAICSYLKNKVEPPVKVKTRSGHFLRVNFSETKGIIDRVSLTGPAKIVFEGNIIIK